MDKPDLLSLDIPALTAMLIEWGEPAYRGRQIFQWLQQKGVKDFSAMSNLPLSLQKKLADQTQISSPSIEQRYDAHDKETVKLLLALADGVKIETVLMLYKRENSRDRATCCVSTQSGCAMGCVFCASGLFKHPRNLSAGELVAQVQATATIGRELGYKGITNVVYMGMGEPLANLANLKQSIFLLNQENGLNIGQRHITVSTCGLVPQIYEMADWGWQISLAVSLHTADQKKRERLMPVAARYCIKDILKACRYFRRQTGRRVTMEYALFAGINDSKQDAQQLADLLCGEDIFLNIILANNVAKAGFCTSNSEIIRIFYDRIRRQGIEAAIRQRRGTDINAACGQLRGRS
ncbi:MAG: 23S rRNA (adenine(2503)-C(2))-methyltransferase RlmN [Clostridiales bacterium]|nr:23S rRNA (adenine(2503)-C(2))-methyltransferase RlmN [Clostridiales bacterium]